MSKQRKRNPGFSPDMPKGEAVLGAKPKRVRKPKASKPDAFDLAKPVEVPVSEPVVDAVVESISGAVTITLTKRLTEKGGLTSYAQPGVRASVYFSKGMFANGELPASITLTGIGLALPGAAKVSPDKAAKAAEKAAKAQARALKAQERAAKAKAKADKASAKAAPAEEPVTA